MKGMPKIIIFCLLLSWVLPIQAHAQQMQHKKQAPSWLEKSRGANAGAAQFTAIGKGHSEAEALNDSERKLSNKIWYGIKLEPQRQAAYEQLLAQEGASYRKTLRLITPPGQYRGLGVLRNRPLDRYRDSGFIYILGGFERSTAEKLYIDELRRLGARIQYYQRITRQSDDRLKMLASARTAYYLADIQQILSIQLANIMDGRSTKAERLLVSNAGLQKAYENRIRQTGISLTGRQTPASIVKSIHQTLNRSGLRVLRQGRTPIRAEVEFRQRKISRHGNNAEFSHWTLIVAFKTDDGRKTYATYKANGREGALTYHEASRRAVKAAAKAAGHPLSTFINQQLLYPNQ